MGNRFIKLARRNGSNDNCGNKNQNQNQTQRNGKNSNQTPVADASEESQYFSPSPIFKLNGHCFDELFEYLALKDLHSLGQTCKSMQRMTGEFFTRYYSGAKFNCLRDGIYLIDSDSRYTVAMDKCIPIPGFMHLINWLAIENNIVAGQNMVDRNGRIDIYHYDMGKFEYIKLHAHKLKSVKKLTLSNMSINKQTVDYVREILPNIEVLELIECKVYQDFYDILLKYCKNVRRIELSGVNFKNWNIFKYKWLRRKYEHLEHLGLGVEHSLDRIAGLCTFFELNPDVRSFSCNESTLWSNKDALLNSNVKLDTFELVIPYFEEKSLWDLLCRLYVHGFYKRLHITSRTNQHCNQLLPAMPFLEQLSLAWCLGIRNQGFSLAPFSTQLIEYAESGASTLSMWDIEFWDELQKIGKTKNETLAEDLINVERLYLPREFLLDIQLFIQRLKNLKKFKLVRFNSAEILQLDVMNEAREKLTGAQKVTIYVPDDVFLATKRTTKNGITNLSLIEIKRTHSIEWDRRVYGCMATHVLPPGMF